MEVCLGFRPIVVRENPSEIIVLAFVSRICGEGNGGGRGRKDMEEENGEERRKDDVTMKKMRKRNMSIFNSKKNSPGKKKKKKRTIRYPDKAEKATAHSTSLLLASFLAERASHRAAIRSMASLTISTSCGLLLLRPKLNRPSSPPLSSATKSPRRCSSPRGAFDLPLAPGKEEKAATPSCSISWPLSAVGGSLGQAAAAAALLAASLFLADPALAFKGGGPYGAEVTRGQDLTGKDFSGKTLIKQDFKTSILRQANFKGAKLVGASFFDADLTGADLSDADLRGADFSLANVTKV
uniref:Thylakoid lumenal 15 kDa protein 1, chloroplastic n=2 Tax=Magnoliopsida TaxID=3398 RepID=A0A6V7Q972_ANACO|nr:unnamed protein product [Ananas comosus var. bracteatus]